MAKHCELCGVFTIFYVWASSRHFNADKLMTLKNIIGTRSKKEYLRDGHVVCFHCVEKHKLMDR
jgi:hypothetical protein